MHDGERLPRMIRTPCTATVGTGVPAVRAVGGFFLIVFEPGVDNQ